MPWLLDTLDTEGRNGVETGTPASHGSTGMPWERRHAMGTPASHGNAGVTPANTLRPGTNRRKKGISPREVTLRICCALKRKIPFVERELAGEDAGVPMAQSAFPLHVCAPVTSQAACA